MLCRRSDDCIGFVEGEGQRLFAKDVLAGAGGGHAQRCVGVGRRADDNDVHVWRAQQVGGVGVGSRSIVVRGLLTTGFVYVGHGHNSQIRHRCVHVQAETAKASIADQPQA